MKQKIEKQQENSDTKRWFFDKISNIDKSVVTLIKKKKSKKADISNIRKERPSVYQKEDKEIL